MSQPIPINLQKFQSFLQKKGYGRSKVPNRAQVRADRELRLAIKAEEGLRRPNSTAEVKSSYTDSKGHVYDRYANGRVVRRA